MEYNHLKWKTLASEYIYKDNWFVARKDTCQKPNGGIVHPYYVLEYTPWACAVAFTIDGKVIIERQYRHALGEVSIELPGGCVDEKDTNNEAAIRRELLEETGYTFDEVVYLGHTSSNPSTNANLMHMFIAFDGRKTDNQNLDANEEIELFETSFTTLMQMALANKIVQAMHITTLFFANNYLQKRADKNYLLSL